jgi:hypothetical protein
VKWLGYAPKLGLLWNVGVYGDWLSKGQTFSTYARQVSGRLAWLPVPSEDTVLHAHWRKGPGTPALKVRGVSFPRQGTWREWASSSGRQPGGSHWRLAAR